MPFHGGLWKIGGANDLNWRQEVSNRRGSEYKEQF
jgi:hypothetical protein